MSISRFSVIKSTCWILLVSGNGLNYCFYKHGGGGHTQNYVCFIENFFSQMSAVVRKPAFCICENKDADQLRGNREADQRLCFRYTDSTIPLLHKSEISTL